ncbi:uncharacterized protein PAC_04630 [Phialocephala subalpina]|uniref:2EXR domain-containing protein n=1 Tax=Phialocephala subalpina TaxID=576137 RepID=A0A1L7WPQ9_9HELO|nr:uncharacterized protein PAC_04630 [Phialocephala subalpina]
MARYPSYLLQTSGISGILEIYLYLFKKARRLFKHLPDPTQRLSHSYTRKMDRSRQAMQLFDHLPDPNQQLCIQLDTFTMYESFRLLRFFKELPYPHQRLHPQFDSLEMYMSNEAVQLFKHLPDPNQQLYIQFDRNLNTSTFTRFLKLPPELRLMVWSHCLMSFSPRSVLVGDGKSIMDCSPAERRKRERQYRGERKLPLPAMLHVCCESRELALERYSVVFWKDLGAEARDWRRPICFDHERDLLYVLCGAKQNHLSFQEWMVRLNFQCNNRLPTVRRFEIRQVHISFWHSELTWLKEHVNNDNNQWTWPKMQHPYPSLPYYTPFEPALDGLFQLRELQVVNFPISKSWDVRIFYWELITEYLRIHWARFKELEAPVVLVRRGALPSH